MELYEHFVTTFIRRVLTSSQFNIDNPDRSGSTTVKREFDYAFFILNKEKIMTV